MIKSNFLHICIAGCINTEKSTILKTIKDSNFGKEMIKLSGVLIVEEDLCEYIKLYETAMVAEHILLEYRTICDMTFDNMIINVREKITLLNFLKKINLTIYSTIYHDEMIKVANQIKTIIYKKINSMNDIDTIIESYDSIISLINQKLNSDITTSDTVDCLGELQLVYNLSKYPLFLINKIVDLIINYYSTNITVDHLQYFNLVEKLGCLNKICDAMIQSLLSNPKNLNTFDLNDSFTSASIIIIFDKILFSSLFMDLLLFFLQNVYYKMDYKTLVKYQLLYATYKEISMYHFISGILQSKESKEPNNNFIYTEHKLYIQKINIDDKMFALEKYYLTKRNLVK